MKTILSIITLVFVSFSVIAQKNIEVEVSEKEMSEGLQTAFSVLIPESSPKLVKSQWKKFINSRSAFDLATKGTSQTIEKAALGISNLFSGEKKKYKNKSLKVIEKGEELIVYNVQHSDVTTEFLDVIAKTSAVEDGVYLSAFFKYADSIYISQANVSESTLNNLKAYMRYFGVETYKVVVEGQIKDEKKILSKEEGELKALQRNKKQLNKWIGKYEAAIDEYKYNITGLERSLPDIEERIQDYKMSLRKTTKKTEEYDLVKENIKQVEKERKRNLREQKSNKKKIKRNLSKIEEAKAKIAVNEQTQEMQVKTIAKQEERIGEFETKLTNIK